MDGEPIQLDNTEDERVALLRAHRYLTGDQAERYAVLEELGLYDAAAASLPWEKIERIERFVHTLASVEYPRD